MDTNQFDFAVYTLRSKTKLLSVKKINEINALKNWAIPDPELDPNDRCFRVLSNLDALPYLLELQEKNGMFKKKSTSEYTISQYIFEEDLVKIFEIFMLSRLYSDYYFKNLFPYDWELNYVIRQRECFEKHLNIYIDEMNMTDFAKNLFLEIFQKTKKLDRYIRVSDLLKDDSSNHSGNYIIKDSSS
jgi:hypothetical protein